jgi:hypothetical protein
LFGELPFAAMWWEIETERKMEMAMEIERGEDGDR